MLVLLGRRHSHEIVFLTYAALTGALDLLGLVPTPALVHSALGPAGTIVWDVAMLASGVLGLYAHGRRQANIRLSLQLELASMLIGAGPLLFYAVIIFVARLPIGFPARLVGGGIVFAWMVANLDRARQIYWDNLKIKRRES